jgi:hypothetical protein
MKNELSIGELESELSAELPTRNLLRRRRHRASAHAHASFGSAANANSTHQSNSNPQTVVNLGHVSGAGINVSSHNSNHNTTNQSAVPINFGL